MGLTDLSFTPSEYILLNGDKFAPESKGKEGHNLLCSDGAVNGPYLSAMLILAAVLANQEEDALTISMTQRKKLFNPTPQFNVSLKTVGIPPNWSGYTLETAVLFITGQLFVLRNECTLHDLVFEIIREDRPDPWQKIIEIVEWGLASSNWLMPVEGVAAEAFLTPFICPANVRELALSQPKAPVNDLLTACKRDTPDIWKQMWSEIEQAFKERKKTINK
jgi:hypothetical protein